MSHLAKLQINFQDHLVTGQNRIEDSIVTTIALPVQSRLDIYRSAYQARLLEALASNFPCLKLYLGDEAFARIGMIYLDAFPSTYRSIRWFGNDLPRFLREYGNPPQIYLSELAEFEWKMTLTFDSDDAHVFELAEMLLIPADAWGDMQLLPHPSVHYMPFYWNIVAIWEAITNEVKLPCLQESKVATPWVMWRQEHMNRFYSLSIDEAWAIEAMFKGLSFGDVCEGLCQWHSPNDVGLQAASYMKGWIEMGLISKVIL